MKHYIQHICGDPEAGIPVAMRFVKMDSLREVNGAWLADWTEKEDERAEWDLVSDARIWRERLGVGVVLHTPLPAPADITDRIIPEPEPEPEPPDESFPDRRKPEYWWQRD